MEEIAIIGGGAAGLAAAVIAAERVRAAGAQRRLRVVVYEASDRVGRSILATGNGRCNFSNSQMRHSTAAQVGYYNAAFVDEALAALAAQVEPALSRSLGNPVLGFFAKLGLAWREEAEGRLYPLANKASVVLDVLRAAAKVAGVEERCGCSIERIRFPRHEGGSLMLRAPGERFEARTAVIACGGGVAPALLADASPALVFCRQEPVLGPLATREKSAAQLDNIRVKCAVGLRRDGEEIAREAGELLFRRYGASGIVVFNLSRLAEPGDVLAVDLIPHVEDAEAFLAVRQGLMEAAYGPRLTATALLRGLLLPQVGAVACEAAGVKGHEPPDERGLAALARTLKGLPLTVEGIADPAQCQVTRGGIGVGAVEGRTLAVQGYPTVFAAGEALDVDGPCGGFNLHWAWASGMLAGIGAAEGALA